MDQSSNNYLLKSGLLCLTLTKDYFRESKSILSKKIRDEIDVTNNKLKLRELDHYFEIGSFVLDDNVKYYKIAQILDNGDLKTHCFVDKVTGVVYKPRNKSYPNKGLVFNIDKCIKFADWRGYYLNNQPDY